MDEALNKITQASHRMAETLYKARSQGAPGPGPQPGPQPGPGPTPPPGAGQPEGTVIDAEYEDPSKK